MWNTPFDWNDFLYADILFLPLSDDGSDNPTCHSYSRDTDNPW
jgi:hypothetical protein